MVVDVKDASASPWLSVAPLIMGALGGSDASLGMFGGFQEGQYWLLESMECE